MGVGKVIISCWGKYSKIKEIRLKPDFLSVFGEGELLIEKEFNSVIKNSFPNSLGFRCSNLGDVSALEVFENSVCITATKHSSTKLRLEYVGDVVENQEYTAVFNSCGEILPFRENSACFLHNQTMTTITFSEIEGYA